MNQLLARIEGLVLLADIDQKHLPDDRIFSIADWSVLDQVEDRGREFFLTSCFSMSDIARAIAPWSLL